ncbi:MAG: response regulator [Deltaproteobacteria bacterium]|nr:MAG: response regulator [Deltaproteobacteria bacterium]TMB46048.1 MAG: response regulator [Deltaproteobacteria bacterium]
MAGCGGTVTQPLPLLDLVEPPAVAPGDSTKVLPSLRGLSVLVVDDALDARDSLAMFLEECGARVTAVASAAEALEALPLARPDVLVSDLAMPGIDGYGLLARMRELEAGGARPVPALALSGHARPQDRERTLAAGFQAHMAKPAEPAELASAVARLAARGRLARTGT